MSLVAMIGNQYLEFPLKVFNLTTDFGISLIVRRKRCRYSLFFDNMARRPARCYRYCKNKVGSISGFSHTLSDFDNPESFHRGIVGVNCQQHKHSESSLLS